MEYPHADADYFNQDITLASGRRTLQEWQPQQHIKNEEEGKIHKSVGSSPPATSHVNLYNNLRQQKEQALCTGREIVELERILRTRHHPGAGMQEDLKCERACGSQYDDRVRGVQVRSAVGGGCLLLLCLLMLTGVGSSSAQASVGNSSYKYSQSCESPTEPPTQACPACQRLQPLCMEDIRQRSCIRGTLSLTTVCNTTYRSFPTGCPSSVRQTSCSSPQRLARCSVIKVNLGGSNGPLDNITCITPFQCPVPTLPPNSALSAPLTPDKTVDVVCNPGYEFVRVVPGQPNEGLGFRGQITCNETGHLQMRTVQAESGDVISTPLDPPDFNCRPVACGLFCRYCSDLATKAQLTPYNSIIKGVDYIDWGWKDFFGPCCQHSTTSVEINSNAARLNGRLSGLNVMLSSAESKIKDATLNYQVELKCMGEYHPVPASGSSNPKCIANPECEYKKDDNEDSATFGRWFWSHEHCKDFRGIFEAGMTCNVRASRPEVLRYEMLNKSETGWFEPDPTQTGCQPGWSPKNDDKTCEFVFGVRLTFANREQYAGSKIVWTASPAAPVSNATGLSQSTPEAHAAIWDGKGITFRATQRGCTVDAVAVRISAVVVVKGKANSELLQTPLLAVTRSNGEMPDRMPACPAADSEPLDSYLTCMAGKGDKSVAFRKCAQDQIDRISQGKPGVVYWCDDPGIPFSERDEPLALLSCAEERWKEIPPLVFSICPAYRYYVLEPVSLASASADAWSISELRFSFRGEVMRPVSVSQYGEFPAAEASWYLADNNVASKLLQRDRCAIEYDMGIKLPFDRYQMATANDCSARDPTRWRIYGSVDRIKWVLIVDQSTTSLVLPTERRTLAGLQPIPLLKQSEPPAVWTEIAFTESTTVPDAQNTIIITFSVKIIVECPIGSPSGQVCTQKSKVVPPLGTTLYIGGFSDVRTPMCGGDCSDFAVSAVGCSDSGTCAPLGCPSCNLWLRSDTVTTPPLNTEVACTACIPKSNSMTSKLQLTFLWCADGQFARVSLQVMNPPEAQIAPVVMQMRAELSISVPNTDVPVDILRAGGSAQLLGAFTRETSREMGRNNSLAVTLAFNFPPMKGSTYMLTGLNSTRTPRATGSSSPGSAGELAGIGVDFVYEDGVIVRQLAQWDPTVGKGTLTVSQPADARYMKNDDGSQSGGLNIMLRFSLVNSLSLQPPARVSISVVACTRPLAIGGCAVEDLATPSVKPRAGVVRLGSVTAGGDDILRSGMPCNGVLDKCKQCDGKDFICAGCDGKANSGKVFDVCGVCDGGARCLGCDGVKDSGMIYDSCGACGGNNDCEIRKVGNITWPHILASLRMVNVPSARSIKASNRLRFALRSGLAEHLLLPAISVDILEYLDLRRGGLPSYRSLLSFSSTDFSTDAINAAAPSTAELQAPGFLEAAVASWAASVNAAYSSVNAGYVHAVAVLQVAVRGEGWRAKVAQAVSASLASFHSAAASIRRWSRSSGGFGRGEFSPQAGVCDARKACWSGCLINAPLPSHTPLTAEELQRCRVPVDALDSVLPPELPLPLHSRAHLAQPPSTEDRHAEARLRRGAADMAPGTPASPVALDTGVEGPRTSSLRMDIRLNYLSAETVRYVRDSMMFQKVVENGTLAGALTGSAFCRHDTPCQVWLEKVVFKVDELPAPPPGKSALSAEELLLRNIFIALPTLFGVLLCAGLVLAYRWRRAVLQRKSVSGFKLQDVMEATERGKKSSLRNALPSAFIPPEGFETNTVASGSPERSARGSSVLRGGQRKLMDDTSSVVSGSVHSGKRSVQSGMRSVSRSDSRIDTFLQSGGKKPMKPEKVDRALIFQDAFPGRSLPQKFDNYDNVAHSDDDGASYAGEEVAGLDGDKGSVKSASAKSGSARSGGSRSSAASSRDSFGSRLLPGPQGRGAAPTGGGSSRVRGSDIRGSDHRPYNHPAVYAEDQERFAEDEMLYAQRVDEERDDGERGSTSSGSRHSSQLETVPTARPAAVTLRVPAFPPLRTNNRNKGNAKNEAVEEVAV